MKSKRFLTTVLSSMILAAGSGAVFAHGFAGKRFFPATIATDDPFVADELSLPTISTFWQPGDDKGPATQDTELSVELSKRITPTLGLSLGAGLTRLQPEGQPSVTGMKNLEGSLKYQFYNNDVHETVLSAGVGVEVGGTGNSRVGADSFSTWTPTFFFGKGFGDLPDSMNALKPLAITGTLGVTFPNRATTTTVDADTGNIAVEQHPHVMKWGLAFEYSIIYLQSVVKDIGLGQPINRMIPIIELAMETPLDRGCGPTTGTVNPGILWAGSYFQIGVEAIIPVNVLTGHNVGVLSQLHFFIDDLFPHSIGQPLFDGK
jgi:hypothetical protein